MRNGKDINPGEFLFQFLDPAARAILGCGENSLYCLSIPGNSCTVKLIIATTINKLLFN
ncbi:hypothetical protein At15955_26820 [Agrobacterium tumefaciens]|nr:hypothetical protein Ach5_27520 [Agrobacterium tumefaciens]AYM17667.1 hypothetical protein At15955_26820 [Agrobacterium tumefaciens]AYM68966.1 hypothetical protein AtA6_27500 [Agrobacterium tumefaciens]